MKDIDTEIRELINKVTEREYVSKLHVDYTDGIWTLYLYLNRELVPMVMSIQGDYEKFKAFVAQEMRKRRLHEVKYWKTNRELPALNCDEETGEWELGW